MFLVKAIADNLCNKYDSVLIFISNIKDDGSVNFISRSSIKDINAGLLMKTITTAFEGNGGGSPTFAQGGIKSKSYLKEIKQKIEDMLNE